MAPSATATETSSECGSSSCNSSDASSEVDEEELQYHYEDAVNEVVELQSELKTAEIEMKQMRTRLQAIAGPARSGRISGVGGPAALPPAAAAAIAAAAAEERRVGELRTLLEWLAEHVTLQGMEVLDVGFEVPVGGRVVLLRRVTQWPLPSAPGGRLRLSVPVEHHQSIAQLIFVIKASGGKVDMEVARRFASVWDLVPGELATADATGVAASRPEPSVLLAHRGSTQGILVANWPTREALEAFHAAAAAAADGNGPRVGDRVEVEYEGKWYVGVLHSVDADGKASVRCDADPDGVLTMTPLYRVRRLSANQGAQQPAVTAVPPEHVVTAAAEPSESPKVAPQQRPDPKEVGHRRTRSSAL